jgi:hypothetical protein
MITNSNTLSWYENTAGAGNPCNFTVYKHNFFSINFPSSDAIPQLFDFNKDSKLDLMVGTKNGRVYYYQNIGTSTAPTFTLVTGSFPNVSLKGDFFVYGLDGFGSPFFYNEGTSTKLLGGCVTGQVYLFDVPASSTATCTLIDSTANNILESTYSTPWFEDVNGDAKPDLFVGNAAGGVSFYSSKAPEVGIKTHVPDLLSNIHVYPNPAHSILNIESGSAEMQLERIEVIDLFGRSIFAEKVNKAVYSIDISSLANGVYFLKMKVNAQGNTYEQTKKIVKH